jgi:hypothetical protein
MSHINPDKRFVGKTEKVNLADLPWLHVYSQPCEHFEARIVGNRKALQILMDTIEETLACPPNPDITKEVRTEQEVFATDGEGYNVVITLLPDDPEKKPMLDNLWDRYPPYYCRDI